VEKRRREGESQAFPGGFSGKIIPRVRRPSQNTQNKPL